MAVECPLCKIQVERLKSDSHVLPKFFLKPIRDQNGQVRVINVFKTIIDPKAQDLPKGTFICKPCEERTADLDSYGAAVLNLHKSAKIQVEPVKFGKLEYERWDGLDFRKFQNFLLSIVLRDYCWRKSEGIEGILPGDRFEQIRTYYMNETARDDTSYPIIMHKIRPTVIPNFHKMTSPPGVSQLGDAVTFMGLGYAIMVYFQIPNEPQMRALIEVFKLKDNGLITPILAYLDHVGTFSRSKDTIAKAGKWYEEKVARMKNRKR